MTDDVLDLLQGKRSLREMVDGMPAKRPPETDAEPKPPALGGEAADDWILLPARGSSYQARSRASNKPIATLHLLLGDTSSKGFSYANLDTLDFVPAKEPGKGPVLIIRFCGIVPHEVRISGRNLETIRDYLGQHRLGWIQEQRPGRDFLGDPDEVITDIEIRQMDE